MYDDPQQAIVQHMLAQHRTLGAMLCAARSDVRDGRNEASIRALAVKLRKIRQEIARHFREEEEGGCLEEAALHCPHLTTEANQIEAEHAELLALLDELIGQAEGPSRSARALTVFAETFETFYRRMRDHEAAENRLLREGLGAPIDAEECGE